MNTAKKQLEESRGFYNLMNKNPDLWAVGWCLGEEYSSTYDNVHPILCHELILREVKTFNFIKIASITSFWLLFLAIIIFMARIGMFDNINVNLQFHSGLACFIGFIFTGWITKFFNSTFSKLIGPWIISEWVTIDFEKDVKALSEILGGSESLSPLKVIGNEMTDGLISKRSCCRVNNELIYDAGCILLLPSDKNLSDIEEKKQDLKSRVELCKKFGLVPHNRELSWYYGQAKKKTIEA